MPSNQLAASALALCLLTSGALGAQGFLVEMPPVRDNTLYEVVDGDVSNGAGDHLFAGVVDSGGDNAKRRALLAFDVAAFLPADAVITSAALTLTMSMSIVGETDVTLHAVTSDWGEGASDAPGQEGAGGPAAPGDATWTFNFFNSSPWMFDGGDFDPTASATAAVAGNGGYTWGSTAAMVSDVQNWIDVPASDFGWLVLGDEALPPPTAKRFDSRENGSVANRPRLVLGFTSSSLIFLDNFESGDVSAWTTSSP